MMLDCRIILTLDPVDLSHMESGVWSELCVFSLCSLDLE